MDVRTLFNEKSKIQKLKEGIVIFEEGSKGHLMYVILEGEVEIVIAGKTNRHHQSRTNARRDGNDR